MTEKEQEDREKLIAAIADILNNATRGELVCMYYFLIAGGNDQNDNRN